MQVSCQDGRLIYILTETSSRSLYVVEMFVLRFIVNGIPRAPRGNTSLLR